MGKGPQLFSRGSQSRACRFECQMVARPFADRFFFTPSLTLLRRAGEGSAALVRRSYRHARLCEPRLNKNERVSKSALRPIQ